MPESEAWSVHSCSTVSVIVQGTRKDNDHRYTLYDEKDSRSEAGIRTTHDNLFVRSSAERLNHRNKPARHESVKTATLQIATVKMVTCSQGGHSRSRRTQSRWQFSQDGYNQDGNLVKTHTIKTATVTT